MELINRYFPELTSIQSTQYTALYELYREWNQKINVISRKDMDQFYCHHVAHSLAIAKFIQFPENSKVMDIGTGGGFPGIPLAILYPDSHFHLVDSIRKKTRVVEEISNSIGLKNITITNDRFENINEKHDFIVSRAVAPALKLFNMTKNAIKQNGQHWLIKGGDLKQEKNDLISQYPALKWQSFDINSIYTEDFFNTKKVINLY